MPAHLVVDASVAIAGGESEHPTSSLCRQFLEEAVMGDHILIMTEEIEREWKNDEKPRSYAWLRRFYARGKKKILWLEQTVDPDLRDDLDRVAYSDKSRLAMLEDVHLLEAARASDYNVSSLDDTVRKIFVKVAGQVEKIQEIAWVNPGIPTETSVDWLKAGAPNEHSRQLGYKDDSN